MPVFHHAGALGDFILSLPLLRALRRLLPRDGWTLAVPEHHARLVSLIFPARRRIAPGSAELACLTAGTLGPVRLADIAGRHGGLFGFLPRAAEVETALRRARPDLPCVLAEPFARAIPAGRTIEGVLEDAIRRADGKVCALGPEDFAIDSRELPPLGADVDPLGFLGPRGSRRAALIHEGASDPAKTAPPRFWREVGRGLEARGFRVGRLQGPIEQEREALAPGQVREGEEPLLDGPDIVLLANAIARSAVYIGLDTGPTHLASALGVPTVAVHLAPNGPWRPRGLGTRVVEGSGGPPGPAEVVAAAASAAGS